MQCLFTEFIYEQNFLEDFGYKTYNKNYSINIKVFFSNTSYISNYNIINT